DLKNRENAKMLPILPAVCAEIDTLAGAAQIRVVVDGVFAGNIFDMGADATAKAFLGHSPDFFNTRATLMKRPWLIDDYDALEARLLGRPIHRKAIFFIDNAGSDFLLGGLPLARWLASRDTEVVLAANARPTLNDMTVDDVRAWWPKILARLRRREGIVKLNPTFFPRFYRDLDRLGQKKLRTRVAPNFPERWMASSVEAINPPPLPSGGLSMLADLPDVSLRDAIRAA